MPKQTVKFRRSSKKAKITDYDEIPTGAMLPYFRAKDRDGLCAFVRDRGSAKGLRGEFCSERVTTEAPIKSIFCKQHHYVCL